MDARKHFVEECYALTNCLHCPDCLAFALKFFKEVKSMEKGKERNIVVKLDCTPETGQNMLE